MRIIITFTYRYYLLIFVSYGLLTYCSPKNVSTPFIKNDSSVFYSFDSILIFNKDSINEVENDLIESIVRKQFNYEKLYYLNPIDIKYESLEGLTVYGYSEYSHFVFFIIKNKNGNVISYDLIAEQTGDGGDFTGYYSTYNSNLTYLKTHESGHYVFSCPVDTTYYSKIQIDSCKIMDNGIINHKIIREEKNKIITSLNQDC